MGCSCSTASNAAQKLKPDKLLNMMSGKKEAGSNENLPMPVRKAIKDSTEAREALLKRIEKATGVSGVIWNIDDDAEAIIKQGLEFKNDAAMSYLTALTVNFEEKCQDKMVKDAVAKAFHKEKIHLKVVADQQALQALEGQKVVDSSNGIQFHEGECSIVTVKSYYGYSYNAIQGADIIKAF